MSLFSQRKGIKPVKSVLQIDSMDDDLRNGLWNALVRSYWHDTDMTWVLYQAGLSLRTLCERLWLDYFNRPIDTLSKGWSYVHQEMRKYFFDCQWYEVYDFIEFIANTYPIQSENKKFMDLCNSVLKRELSAYRFVAGKITQITSKEEIAEIEEALEAPEPLKPVSAHLKRGLDSLADRKSPDYRNSIKESINAVEAICRLITGKPKATLGQALKKIEGKVAIHPALKKAFNNLYGYTSDAEGIRHALLDEPNLNFEDAKFMLVSCSAFINYLVSKWSKAGMNL